MGETAAHKNRRIRQEALREQLSSQGHVQHVVDNLAKLSNLAIDMDSLEVQRIGKANEGHLKLINKYLPDLKSTELTGEGGGEVGLTHRVVEYVVPDSPPEI